MTSVCLVSTSAKPGGAERVLASLARWLPAHGFEPVAVVLERGPLEEWLARAGCDVVLGSTPGLDHPDAVRFVRSQIERAGAAAVVSSKWTGHLVGGAAAVAAGVPAIWWQHDATNVEWSPPVRAAAEIPAAAVVCVSEYAARTQAGLTPGARIEIVHPGVPVEEIAARRGAGAEIRRALFSPDQALVGIVGRLQRWKGQDTFLRAAHELAGRRQDVRFAIVGGAILGLEGSFPDELRWLATDLGLADRVHFAGHQPDVYPWLDALDVLVHAGAGEPFGLVLVEAMALGKPLVATVPGGPAEIVEDGRDGLLVPAGDHRALAATIERLLDDGALASALAAAAEQRARRFSEERMAAEFAAVLRPLYHIG